MNGQVSFDGKMVTISRKGGMARATVGKGEKRIPVKSIAAVQWKAPSKLVRGFIQFTVPGGNESKGRTTDAAKDENSVIVGKKSEEEFLRLREAIEEAISA